MKLSPAQAASESPEGLRIQLLGDFQISVNSRAIANQDWPLRKARSLMQLLALAPGHQRSGEQVIESLWPGTEPEKALNSLHRTLYVVRRVLEPERANGAASSYLIWQDDRLVLGPPDSLWIDVDAFESECAAARQTKDPHLYTSALALYTGDLLPEQGYERWERWVSERREQLRAAYLKLLKEAAQLYLARRDILPAIDVLENLTARDPFQEDMQRELMRVYAISGQRYQAIRQYQRLRSILRKEWHASPEDATTALFQEIRAGRVALDPQHMVRLEVTVQPPAPTRVLDKHLTNLPTHTAPFIGRSQESEHMRDLLKTTRLLTLIGPGGSGKTRLAEQVAGTVLEMYPDGVWLVELAALIEADLLPQAVATTLGLQSQGKGAWLETLVQALQDKQILLVLDNCEHLLKDCADLVNTLLQACPRLTVLATSRRALHIQEEKTWSIPLLRVPDPERLPAFDELLSYDAIQFFLERANALHAALPLTPLNAPAIVHICHRLDGIPLAIELAARRTQIASVNQIMLRLDDCFAALAPGKRGTLSPHQTLQAAIDWSYKLLTPTEQLLFRRLSVFHGGWQLEEAEQVCSDEPIRQAEVLGLLEELADWSLIVVERNQEDIRYHFLEIIRQYSVQQCRASGEEGSLRERHASCYLHLAETAEPELTGPNQESWFERLASENDNLRAALRWACEHNAVYAVRMVAALWRFWHRRGYLSEGLAHAQEVLALHVDESPSTQLARARALAGSGVLVYLLGDLSQSLALYESALALFRQLGEKSGIVGVLNSMGMMAQYRGEHERALAIYQEALVLCRELGDVWRTGVVLNNLGTLLKDQGRYREAMPLAEESLACFRQVGDLDSTAGLLNNVAVLLLAQGEFDRATRLFEEALVQLRQQQDKLGGIEPLQNLAMAAQRQGHYERARGFLQEAMVLSREIQDEWGLAIELQILGLCAFGEGAFQEADECYQECLGLQRKLEYKQGIATVLVSLGNLRVAQNNPREARALYAEGLLLCQQTHDQAGLAAVLEGLACLAAEMDRADQAGRFFAAAAALRRETGAILPPCEQPLHEQRLEQMRTTLGDAAWEQAWQAGAALPLERVIAEALALTSDTGENARTEPSLEEKPARTLSPRERQLVGLLAQGLTNREIAALLAISIRTVDKHVTNLLAKLSLPSRTQVGVWASAHGLTDPMKVEL